MTSSNNRCCGSIDVASRGEIRKIADRTDTDLDKVAMPRVHLSRCFRIRRVVRLDTPSVSWNFSYRLTTFGQKLPIGIEVYYARQLGIPSRLYGKRFFKRLLIPFQAMLQIKC